MADLAERYETRHARFSAVQTAKGVVPFVADLCFQGHWGGHVDIGKWWARRVAEAARELARGGRECGETRGHDLDASRRACMSMCLFLV